MWNFGGRGTSYNFEDNIPAKLMLTSPFPPPIFTYVSVTGQEKPQLVVLVVFQYLQLGFCFEVNLYSLYKIFQWLQTKLWTGNVAYKLLVADHSLITPIRLQGEAQTKDFL